MFVFLVVFAVPPAAAQGCPDDGLCGFLTCRAGASGVAAALWGELVPVDTGSLPADRDNTDYDEFHDRPGPREPFWMSVDIENGWIFAAISQGLEVWDATGAMASNPVKKTVAGPSDFPNWAPDPHETQPVRDADAPGGVDSVVAVALVGEGGVAIFDASTKTRLRSVYGDVAKKAYQVYAARIGGRNYAFAATADGGLLAYDMSTAAGLASECVEETPGQQGCGVYVGRLGSRRPSYVDGAANAAATAHWVAASDGYVTEIWNVSSPTSPRLVLSGLSSSIGVALWQSGSSFYLGTRARTGSGTEAQIYDVSCIASGNCNGFGAPIWRSAPLPDDAAQYFVTYSHSGNRHFLYYGSANRCPVGIQNEWLLDVTLPSQASDITPPPALLDGQNTGYWGFYYRRNATGFNRVAPLVGKFAGPYFYRAAHAIFDIHELAVGVAPTANFTYSPQTVYRGQQVNFTDTSTGRPDSWDWSFQGAAPATSTAQHPTGVVFNSAGVKQVSLTATNGQGSDVTTKMINVLDPTPQVAGVTVSPNPAFVCQPVTFMAQSVTGSPAPSLSWQVKDGGGTVVDSGGNVNPHVWNTASVAAGTYTATVTATNTAGMDTATSPAVTVQALPALPADGSFTPTNDVFTSGTVQFHVDIAGATEWNWDFGDGITTGWISDPVSGPNPMHTYAAVGTYEVTVQVRNCVETTPRTSAIRAVDVTQITPLIANFQAQGIFCTGAGCFADRGVPIAFADNSEGNPDFWDYDWDGDGTYEDSGHTAAVGSHTYNQDGSYTPTLRVRRGGESDVFTHVLITVSGGGGGGSSRITISGPSSGEVNQSLVYSASASGCTPAANGWNWSITGGGTISGATSSSQVTVSWDTAGAKSVSAANSSCPSASISPKSVTISNPGGGGGGSVNANFTFTPTAPETGAVVTFDASISTGGVQTYNWSFGDGGTGSGRTVTHVFAQPGPYPVTLDVSKLDPACPAVGGFNICTDREVRTVVVSDSGPPPLSAGFTANATCSGSLCITSVGQEVSFESTTEGADQYAWDFGDGDTANGPAAVHTWTAQGQYTVAHTVRRGQQQASVEKTFVVEPGALTAGFSADVTCTGDSCFTTARQEVTLHSTGSGGSELEWDFGDGEGASGEEVTHAWGQEGEYTVTLTVREGELEASASKTFFVDPPEAFTSTVVLPWIADTSGALEQVSDLYITNPGDEPMEVTITFRKRGLPENPPPGVGPLTVAPHQTLYFPDALVELFDRNDTGGFLLITAEDVMVDPVVVSLNRTQQSDGITYGQMVPGITLPELDAAADAGGARQYLLGLTDTDERHSYFGITNPHGDPAVYVLTFYDQYGELISGPSAELSVSGWGQKQFQIQELRDEFGLVGRTDYRVEIEQLSGETFYPYGGVIRQGTQDPSFVRVSVPSLARTYLVGAASTTGFNNAFFQTDAVISNPTDQLLQLDVSYRNVGLSNEGEDPQGLTLQPMETRRIQDVLFNLWGIETSVGVLTFESAGAGGLYPMIHGETYQNSGPQTQFGLFMPARRDEEAAGVDQRVIFTGLRQLDGDSNTTVWLFNPSQELGRYDLVYYALDGTELGRMEDYLVGAGAIRQINPSRHLLPPGGVEGGFALEIHVLHGQLIGGANVVINQSNDPAYVAGSVR